MDIVRAVDERSELYGYRSAEYRRVLGGPGSLPGMIEAMVYVVAVDR